MHRLRVDSVGSLIRPRPLVEAFTRRRRGEIDDTELTTVQDDAVRKVIATQEAYGLPVVTDGEFRRTHFMQSFGDVSGFAHGRLTPVDVAVVDENATPPGKPARARGYLERGAIVEPLRLRKNRILEEFRFAEEQATAPVKVSLINPARILEACDVEGSRGVYADVGALTEGIVAVQREMVGGLVAAGCRYVHVDAPGYTAHVDEETLAALRLRGDDPEESLDRAIRADNAVMAGFDGVTFGLHVCRGNFRGRWAREGSYDAIAERLYNGLNHQRLLLEYDTARAGGFESLRFVPMDKTVVLGLISTKSRELETAEQLLRRIEEASRFVPVDQLALSPQCGFGSVHDGNPLDADDQWRKLDLMIDVAARVWD